MKILIVEDDKFLQNVLAKKLTKEGYEVIQAFDGEEGLQQIITQKPDLILLDIILPKKNGFFLLEEIKNDPELSKVPVIIVSALGQAEDINKGMELGAVSYFVKAKISLDDLIKKIKEYVPILNQ
jgi:DNA-binding response OmpR family regulator